MTSKIKVINEDITKLNADAIVNAANTSLFGGTGVCGAIFDIAGYEDMSKACQEIGFCNFGEAVITPGFNLPSKFVIHTVGPISGQHNSNESEILYSCYYESLRLAEKQKEIASIGFPEIATGMYGYPVDEAREVASKAINDYFSDVPDSNIQTVYVVRFK